VTCPAPLILQSIKTKYRGGIELLDLVSKDLGRTLWQLILEQTLRDGKCLFISRDRNLFLSEINFSFPTMCKEEVNNRMLPIGAYLHKDHGNPVIQFFTTSEQTLIKTPSGMRTGSPSWPLTQWWTKCSPRLRLNR